MEIVREYHLEGKRNKTRLAQEYGIGKATVCDILRNFAAENDKSALLMKNKPTDSQSEEIKALKKEVLELKRQLYDETMRADFYDTMIDVAEEMFGIEIRKKAGTGQSKGCTGKSGTK
jgi:transposase-like protein